MEEKIKIHLEYLVNCSPKVLYNRLSTAAGLAEWFADNVTVKGKIFTFTWDATDQQAEKTLHKENKMVRYSWLDCEEEDCYFEFKINQDELTNDVSLIVTDFAEVEEEQEVRDLWDMQISDLKRILGS